MILTWADTIIAHLWVDDHTTVFHEFLQTLQTLRVGQAYDGYPIPMYGPHIVYDAASTTGHWLAFRTWIDEDEGLGLRWRMYDRVPPAKSNLWPIEVDFGSVALWARPFDFWWEHVASILRYVADAPHLLYTPQGEWRVRSRVSRLDWAIDSDEWTFVPEDLQRFVSRTRMTHLYETEEEWLEYMQELPEVSHLVCRRFTGFSFGKTPVHVRIYHKDRELMLSQQDTKAKFFFRLWEANGWDVGRSVWRVEIEIRREALHQMHDGTRAYADMDVDEVVARFPTVLRYWLLSWLSLRQPTDDTNRSRWPLDETWKRVIETASEAPGDFARVFRAPVLDAQNLARQQRTLLAKWALLTRCPPEACLTEPYWIQLAEALDLSPMEFLWSVHKEMRKLAGRLGVRLPDENPSAESELALQSP
ncbi:hypothetical protein [Alicyclobacillus sendaiensis]|uniref:hypothetical protein n=1 Tax=Alicyclobacillus sendaiensis TaxID=192387 RepID=UPI0026F4280D|nr:hypothetical protein [Alicyclobacillus sendaiensis]